MILENSSLINSQNYLIYHPKEVSNQKNTYSPQQTQLSRIKSEFHKNIRIRELNQIRAERRRIHQINLQIQQVLRHDFPKESYNAKEWAENLIQLFTKSKKFEVDPFKLRQIFLIAQKFPCRGTLYLFYIAVINTNSQNIRTLFDLDIWRFLHNILKYPDLNSQSQDFEISFSLFQGPKRLKIKSGEVQMITAAIQTFIQLFKKDIAFRDYSIERHLTFSNYVQEAYQKFGGQMKLQMIYFLKAVFVKAPNKYSKQYLRMIKLTYKMIVKYYQKFSIFFVKGTWNDIEFGQQIEEVVKRGGFLIGIMERIFQYANNKWILDYVGNLSNKNQSYLDIMVMYLSFGRSILNQLLHSDKSMVGYFNLFEDSFEFMHNVFLFYENFAQKNIINEHQNMSQISQIMKQIVWVLNLIKKCEQSKKFSEAHRQLVYTVQKTKQLILFVIDNAINSQFDKYDSFFKKFIFCNISTYEQINLLNLLYYLLDTVYLEKVLLQLINVIFSMLNIEVPHEELNDFMIISQMIEKIWQMIGDKMVTQDVKINICQHIISITDEGYQNIGSLLKIKEKIKRQSRNIEKFMNSQLCSTELFKFLDQIMKSLQETQYESQNQTLLI